MKFDGSEIYLDQLGQEHLCPPGTKVEWRLSGYLLVQRNDEILLVKSSWRDVWELPGGGIEPQESLGLAALREAREETGYSLQLSAPNPYTVTEGRFYLLEEATFLHSVRFFFRADLTDAKKERAAGLESGEITKIDWVSTHALREEICHPIHWPAIQMARSIR